MRCIVVVIGLAMWLANPVAAYRDQIADHAKWLQDVGEYNAHVMEQLDTTGVAPSPSWGP